MFESRIEDGGTGLRRGGEELTALVEESRRTGRRMFLRWAGISVAGIAVAACAESTAPSPNATATSSSSTPQKADSTSTSNGGIDLGSGDVGILNYAFALEQLEAAFYQRVLQTPYSGMTDQERNVLNDIRKHESIHARFLAEALGPAGIPFLSLTFASVDFSSRMSVLNAARDFEDVGVSAYNGAGHLIDRTDYLVVAGKIVSVEARHAAAIRDLIRPKSAYFAGDDVVDPTTGLDVSRMPSEVLKIVYPTFITTAVDPSHLPTS